MTGEKTTNDLANMSEAVKLQRLQTASGPVASSFLCASISVLDPSEPETLSEKSSVSEVMQYLQGNKLGCAVIVDDEDRLTGIFSERDYVLKVYGQADADHLPISQFMTREPITIAFDETVAFALTLMSQGGFRHLPIVDDSRIPIGMVTVKNIVDHLSLEMMDELLSFEVE